MYWSQGKKKWCRHVNIRWQNLNHQIVMMIVQAVIFSSLSTLEVTTVKSYTMKVGNTSMDLEVLLDGEHIAEEENPF
jgi:hypothetical protein